MCILDKTTLCTREYIDVSITHVLILLTLLDPKIVHFYVLIVCFPFLCRYAKIVPVVPILFYVKRCCYFSMIMGSILVKAYCCLFPRRRIMDQVMVRKVERTINVVYQEILGALLYNFNMVGSSGFVFRLRHVKN